MVNTKLYGLVEGIIGTHIVNQSPEKLLMLLPAKIRKKCKISGNSIRAYNACDG